MNRLRRGLGYAWAAVAVPLVLATFLAQEPLSRVFARATGLSISPWFSGGEIAQTVEHAGYQTHVHQAVFDGLMGERRRGFVQVEWQPVTALPAVIDEEIAGRGEARGRFRIRLDTRTGKAELTDRSPDVLGIDLVSPLRGGWAVRILLDNPR